MIEGKTGDEIIEIWNAYIASERASKGPDGNYWDAFDSARQTAIVDIKLILQELETGAITLPEFKSKLDSYNKRNNLWGFTATKGQMFFNQILRESEPNLEQFTKDYLLYIKEPTNRAEAVQKIEQLEKYSAAFYAKQEDKRRGPNPVSVGYFLSYFWQIRNPEKWPILYSSLLQAWEQLGLWSPIQEQGKAYEEFNRINEEIREVLQIETGTKISNWLIEHAFWHYLGNEISSRPKEKSKPASKERVIPPPIQPIEAQNTQLEIKPKFDLSEYLGTRASRLLALGSESEKPSSQKGYEFEQGVSEVFKMLGFDMTPYGQGKGRFPDAVLKYPRERVAFMVDAKAYSKGYSIGTDYRAIDDYISTIGQQLIKDGYSKLGFIIVSNSFIDSEAEQFAGKVTWNTEVRRFIFLETEALLYLLALKIKDGLSVTEIIGKLVGSGHHITPSKVLETFGDY